MRTFQLPPGFRIEIVAADPLVHDPVAAAYDLEGNLWVAEFSSATLSRFFAIHVFLVPACIFAFIGLHLRLVLRHGISEPPTPGKKVDPKTYRQEYRELMQKSGHPFWPDGAWRDVVFGFLIIGRDEPDAQGATVRQPSRLAPREPRRAYWVETQIRLRRLS